MVFITAGRDELDEADLATASQSLAALADAKIPWQIVRMSAAGVDSQSTELAEQGHGEISTVNSAADVHAMLLKKLVGRSSTIAGGVTLKLTFSSRQVSGYRLLGHESSTLTGAPTGPLEIDFQADEAATALVELTLKPGGEGPVAAAELSWRDPASGRPRREVRVIKREDLTGAFSKAPPWLQQGAIAAKAAEALRGSYFAPVSHPAGQVLSVAEQVDPRVAEQPDFRGLLDLLRQAEKRR